MKPSHSTSRSNVRGEAIGAEDALSVSEMSY